MNKKLFSTTTIFFSNFLLNFFILSSDCLLQNNHQLTSGVDFDLDDYDREAIISRRKSFLQKRKTTLSPNHLLYKFDWVTKDECHVDDSSNLCRLLENGTTCFGASLPFTHSSTKHLESLNWRTTIENFEKFNVFSGLPECWKQMRELLCAVFYPPCKDGLVLRVSRDLCMETRTTCKFLIEKQLWPNFFGDCQFSNETSATATSTTNGLDSVFTNDCKTSRNMIWNSTPVCVHPLIVSDYKTGWIIDQCALNCTSIRIDRSQPIQSLLMIGLFIIFILTFLVATLLFFEERRDSTLASFLYPLYWFSVCHLFLSACWLIQIVSGANTICRNDGSVRLEEPTRREPLHAGILCIIQYMVLLGGAVGPACWLVVFAYLHYLWRKSSDDCNFSSYHHLGVWCLVIVMITCGLTTTQVDGDPVLSVCFVRKASLLGVIWYIAPLSISPIITLTLFALTVRYVTRKNKTSADEIAPDKPKAQVPTINQVGALLFVILPLYFGSAALTFMDMVKYDQRQNTIADYVACNLKQTKGNNDPTQCQLQSDGDIRLAQFHVLLMCAPALVVDVWFFVCTDIGQRFWSYFKCGTKKKHAAANGDLVLTEITSAGGDESTNAPMVDGSGKHGTHRNSWNWSSSSSIVTDLGVMSDGETRGGRHRVSSRAFIDRITHRRAGYRNANSKSTNSLASNSMALCSIKTPASLQSGPLPSDVMPAAPSYPDLPFPDIDKYPVVPANAGWWPPYGWPYAPWPWVYCYPHPSAAMANSTSMPPVMNPHLITPPLALGAAVSSSTDVGQQATTSLSPVQDSVMQIRNQAPPESMMHVGNASHPFYWPPPMAYPQYWPPHTTQMFPTTATTENQLNIRPATTSVSSPTSTEVSKSSRGAKSEKKAANDDDGAEAKKDSENEKKIADRRKEENSPSEDEDDEEEEEQNSEEVDSEEEAFVQEQLRLLLGTNESRS